MDDEIIVGLVVLGAFVWLLTPVMRAWAERIRVGEGGGSDVQRLRDELTDGIVALRRDVADLTERIEFAERLLAKQREPDRLPRGS